MALPALPQDPVFRTNVKLVVVNVSIKDRSGKPIENLTKDDFQIFEDGKPQRLQTVELQRLAATALAPIVPTLQTRAPATVAKKPAPVDMSTALSKYQDRRLIVILFDFSSMDIPEQVRSVDAAQKFISTQMTASDTVSLMIYSGSLRTLQEFTDDRDALLTTLRGLHIGEGSELNGLADTGADAEDQSGQFVADETEFNIFNTDLKLMALEDAAKALAPYPEKKSLIYFSSGVEKTGVDNQSQLRATINTAPTLPSIPWMRAASPPARPAATLPRLPKSAPISTAAPASVPCAIAFSISRKPSIHSPPIREAKPRSIRTT